MKKVVPANTSLLFCAVLLVGIQLQATPIPVPGCSSLTSLPGPSFTCVAGDLTYSGTEIHLPNLDILSYTVTAPAGQTIDNVGVGSNEYAAYVEPANGTSDVLYPGTSSYSFTPTDSVTILSLINPSIASVNGNSILALNTITDPVATPEPGFYGLLAVGLAGIFMWAKRRHKSV